MNVSIQEILPHMQNIKFIIHFLNITQNLSILNIDLGLHKMQSSKDIEDRLCMQRRNFTFD